MNMRNLLKPGDFAMLVPMGIHLTLQYNVSGNLENVYYGFNSDKVKTTSDFMEFLVNQKIIPSKIHITKGTSWIRGVLYTDTQYSTVGDLPNAVKNDMVKLLMKTPSAFKFYAATIESTALAFKGSTPTRQCLAMARFEILPGWVVPYNISERTINEWMATPQYKFSQIATDYIVYHDDVIYVLSAGLKQAIVERVTKYEDINGYIKAEVEIKYPQHSIHLDFSDVVKMNIHKNSILIFNDGSEIISCRNDKKSKSYSNALTCSYCGKVYAVPDSGPVICPDLHCPSRLFKSIVQFIDVLKLPKLDNDVIISKLKNHEIICIPDLLLLNEYADICVDVSFMELLRALVPKLLIPRDDVLIAFSAACPNTEATFKYYIENPEKISSDLGVQHTDLEKLVFWLSDNCNLSDIGTLLESEQINIISDRKKFNGAPIFRDKLIYLTGSFIRGTSSEIAVILQSYAATVTTQFSTKVDCVLTGGKRENIDGKSVNYARRLNIPIISEDDFFNQYEIDTDLNNNLV